MARIVWDESFSVKVAEIDEQHRHWIEIINKLHDSIMSKEVGGRLTGRILAEMRDYASFHFTFEEDYLRQIAFPGLSKHRHEHQFFLKTIEEKLQAERRGELVLNTEVMSLLTGWLRNHILSEDREYMVYSQSRAN